MIFIKKCDKVRIIQWYIADRIYTEKSFKEIYDLKQLEEIVRTEKNIWGLRSRCNQCISSDTDYSKRCLGCIESYTGGRSEKSVDNYKFCYSYWKRFAEREVNLMNNKHASIELIDEMAKVKDDFKILPKDIIESMLEDMTAEEKDMLLRLYIFGTNIDQ